jgi:hypothetical protein
VVAKRKNPVVIKLIHHNGAEETSTLNTPPTLEHMQKLVGGYIERVNLKPSISDGFRWMILDEEGRLKHKPYNPKATALMRANYPTSVSIIVGDVILLTHMGG